MIKEIKKIIKVLQDKIKEQFEFEFLTFLRDIYIYL